MEQGSREAVTVALVDDHAIVRQGVRALLEMQPDIEVVGEAADGAAAVRLCEDFAPDVALVDLVMPGSMDGVTATREIKRVSPRTQVIVLTSFLEDRYVVPALRAGALSYLLKDITGDELLDAVRKAARGESILSGRVAAQIVRALNGNAGGADVSETPDPFADLSDRERDVLRLLAQGLSNGAIAEALFISEKTVKSHVSNILGKLHLAQRAEAVALAWRAGFVGGKDTPNRQ